MSADLSQKAMTESVCQSTGSPGPHCLTPAHKRTNDLEHKNAARELVVMGVVRVSCGWDHQLPAWVVKQWHVCLRALSLISGMGTAAVACVIT